MKFCTVTIFKFKVKESWNLQHKCWYEDYSCVFVRRLHRLEEWDKKVCHECYHIFNFDIFSLWTYLSLREGIASGSKSFCWNSNNYENIQTEKNTFHRIPKVGKGHGVPYWKRKVVRCKFLNHHINNQDKITCCKTTKITYYSFMVT